MTKRRSPTERVWPTLPVIEGALVEPSLDDLLDDDEWTRATIGHDLAGQSLGKRDVAQCRFVGCRLTAADLRGSRFVDVEFVDCELSGATLEDAVLTRVALRGCRMSGTVLTSAKLRDVTISECRADELGARMCAGERTVIERTMLRDADFYGARFEQCRITDCDLTNAQFSAATFSATSLQGSDLSALRGIEHISGVTIDPDQVHDFMLGLLAARKITVTAEREPISLVPGT